jgi:hypothetical protein
VLHRDGAASELEYHLLLARDLKLLNAADYAQLARDTSEVKRMLTGLMQKGAALLNRRTAIECLAINFTTSRRVGEELSAGDVKGVRAA